MVERSLIPDPSPYVRCLGMRSKHLDGGGADLWLSRNQNSVGVSPAAMLETHKSRSSNDY